MKIFEQMANGTLTESILFAILNLWLRQKIQDKNILNNLAHYRLKSGLFGPLVQAMLYGRLCLKVQKNTQRVYEMAGKNTSPVPEAGLKILKDLSKEKIPFVIVGGAAIVLHGIPRSTLDIDVVMPSEAGVVAKLFSLAKRKNFLIRDKDIVSIVDKPRLLIGQWITLQDKSGGELVDIFFENEKEFDALFKRAKRIKVNRFNIYVASLYDLQAMKKASGRPIDLADIVLIKEKNKRK